MKISKTIYGLTLLMIYTAITGCSTPAPQTEPETVVAFSDVPSAPIQLLKGRVSCRIPNRWKLMQETKENGHRQAYFIPFKEAEGTNHSANASLVAEPCSKSLTVQGYGDSILAQMIDPQKGNVIVNDNPDGKGWRSVLWRGQYQIPYLVWDRFGVKDGTAVHLRVSYPLIQNSSQSQQIISSEINTVTESLAIK